MIGYQNAERFLKTAFACSQNHCIMFGSTYLELLAAPKPHPWLDYYRSFGDGLAAIALSTDDADAASRELGAKPPIDLSRPVEGGVAHFRLVQLENVPYVFVCQHLTRELVWQPAVAGARERRESSSLACRCACSDRSMDCRATSNGAGRPCCGYDGKGKAAEAHGVRLEFS